MTPSHQKLGWKEGTPLIEYSHQKLGWKEGTPLIEYEILDELLHGNRGVIYSSLHRENRNPAALVVLKHQNEALGAGRETSPLLFELESLKTLAHPILATVREVWYFEGLLFLVSNLPEGEPLLEAIEPLGRDTPKGNDGRKNHLVRTVRLVAALAEALSQAHCQGLTHRDLRAEDIYVNQDGSPTIMGLCWASLLGRP
ncbi:MAG: protein kinase domain-containing protein, partial [Planctomycetota bacterium]